MLPTTTVKLEIEKYAHFLTPTKSISGLLSSPANQQSLAAYWPGDMDVFWSIEDSFGGNST